MTYLDVLTALRVLSCCVEACVASAGARVSEVPLLGTLDNGILTPGVLCLKVCGNESQECVLLSDPDASFTYLTLNFRFLWVFVAAWFFFAAFFLGRFLPFGHGW